MKTILKQDPQTEYLKSAKENVWTKTKAALKRYVRRAFDLAHIKEFLESEQP